jgi:hypothetical protein
MLDRRQDRVEEIKLGNVTRQQVAGRQSRIGVFGCGARHGDGTLRKRIDRVVAAVVRRDHGLPASDQDAQAEVVALRPLALLYGAAAHLDGESDRAHRHGIGGIRTRPARRLHEANDKLR